MRLRFVRGKADGILQNFNRIRVAACIVQRDTKIDKDGGVGRIKPRCLSIRLDCFCKPSHIKQKVAQIAMIAAVIPA